MRKARVASRQTPELFLQDCWKGAVSLTALCFPFSNYFFVFLFAFLLLLFPLSWELCSDRPSLVNGFSFNKLPFCDTPPEKCLGKFPTTSSLCSGAHFIPKSWANHGPNHPWASLPPLQGIPSARELAPRNREGICIQGAQSFWRWQPRFEVGEGVIQHFWQEQNNDAVSGFDLERVAVPLQKKKKNYSWFFGLEMIHFLFWKVKCGQSSPFFGFVISK